MVRVRFGASLVAGVFVILSAVAPAIVAQQAPPVPPAGPAAGRGQAPAPAPGPAGRGAQPAGRGAQPAGRGAGPLGVARDALGEGPWVFDTAEQHRLKVVSIARGLVNPWSLVFLPDGAMLVTERPGRLRIIRNGVLDPEPIKGVPAVAAQRLCGLMEIALHPRFAENQWLYFTYSKPGPTDTMVTTLARGRFDGRTLSDVKDLLVAEPYWDCRGGAASRLAFAPDGLLFMTTGASGEAREEAQDTMNLRGKMLRLRDDGTPAPGNPFIGRAGFKPEIYSYGHRNQLGLTFHPQTGALWNAEHGPNGGDELNIIVAGKNYGWPNVSLGRDYAGPWQGKFAQDGVQQPEVYWMPSIGVGGLLFYNGTRFPSWRGNAIVGSMRFGEIPNTGHMQRIVFNERGEEIRREMFLTELRQRVREVREGPDGYIYILTDETAGGVFRLEPAP
jgi:glucose/arabinose dehydrogenase